MNQKRYVVGLGEVLWDVLPEGKKLGGAPANFAYHAGQFLGCDNTIAISALGEDKLAEETIEALDEHNLNYLLPRVPYVCSKSPRDSSSATARTNAIRALTNPTSSPSPSPVTLT